MAFLQQRDIMERRVGSGLDAPIGRRRTVDGQFTPDIQKSPPALFRSSTQNKVGCSSLNQEP